MKILTWKRGELSEKLIESSKLRLVIIDYVIFIIDMNMIIGTLVNSMLAYMSLYHFEEAEKCADFILDHYLKDPEIYYRKAQNIYFNN